MSQFDETRLNDQYLQYNPASSYITIQKTGSYNLQLNYNSLVGYRVTTGTATPMQFLAIQTRVIKNGSVISTTPRFNINTPQLSTIKPQTLSLI